MALTTRRKSKPFQKKRLAAHHRRSKLYLKAYHPYLPILAIVVMGVVVNKLWSSSDNAVASFSPAASNRLALFTGNSSAVTLYTILAVTAAAFAVFIVLHWYRVQRFLNRGEQFAVEHPWLDVALAFIVTAGVILTRS